MTILLLLLSLLLTARAQATVIYVSPSGDDHNSCVSSTPTTPRKTMRYVLQTTGAPAGITNCGVQAGDVVILKDGTYTGSTTGFIDLDCSANANNGSAGGGYITIKADHERQAYLQGDGTDTTLFMQNCAYWWIEGLRVSQGDGTPGGLHPDYAGTLMTFHHNVDHLVIRRHLLHNQGRGHNVSAVHISGKNTLVEENEIYTYVRYGIVVDSQSGNETTNLTFRRNYLNSRYYPQSGTCPASGTCWAFGGPDGDGGIAVYQGVPVHNMLFENNILENNNHGLLLNDKYSYTDGAGFSGNLGVHNYKNFAAYGCTD